MLALKNSRVNFKKLFNKKRNEVPLPKTSIKGKVQEMKKITYYNTDLEKYVEIEVPININIVTESERFDTQKMLAIGYEKSKIKNKQEEEENKLISNIYDSYLDNVIYDTYSTLPLGICDVFDDCLKNDVLDDVLDDILDNVLNDCLENDVYNIYNAFDEVSSFYSNV
jgi:hypothetical protein